jgi:hypothetical protein
MRLDDEPSRLEEIVCVIIIGLIAPVGLWAAFVLGWAAQ